MKLNFDDAMQRINDGRYVDPKDVQSSALRRVIWCAEWHIPGCLSESQGYALTKSDAISEALNMCGNVRGAKSDLIRYGRTDRVSPDAYVSMAITTVSRTTLGEIL